MSTDQIKVAVLTNGQYVQKWIAEALEELRLYDSIQNILDNGAWGAYQAARWMYRQTLGSNLEFRKPVPIDEVTVINSASRRSCIPIEDGMWNKLPKDIASELEKTDVALRFGFGLLKGDALQAPEYGVLSFHHGDLREYRGPPAGFWEYLHNKDTAGVTLQRLNESIDEGEIVAFETVDISDAATWGEVQRRLFETSVAMLPHGIKHIRNGNIMTPEESGAYHGYPDSINVCKYFIKSATSYIKYKI